MQDVQRQLPLERQDPSSRFDVIKILNIDLPIILTVLVLTVYGSVVLYSASGKDLDLVVGKSNGKLNTNGHGDWLKSSIGIQQY